MQPRQVGLLSLREGEDDHEVDLREQHDSRHNRVILRLEDSHCQIPHPQLGTLWTQPEHELEFWWQILPSSAIQLTLTWAFFVLLQCGQPSHLPARPSPSQNALASYPSQSSKALSRDLVASKLSEYF